MERETTSRLTFHQINCGGDERAVKRKALVMGRGLSLRCGPRRSRFWLVFVVCASAGGMLVAQCPTALALSVGKEWISDVSSSSVTLHAIINSEAEEAIYRFEYGTSVAYGINAPGEHANEFEVHAHIQGLVPKATYHFHLVATSLAPANTVEGIDKTFTTQPVGSELTLPDDRKWELVSPAIKDGAYITPFQEHGEVLQAAEDGGAVTYLSIGSMEANPAGNANETQVLSSRNIGGGWSSRDIATPHEVTTGIAINTGQEYKFFSPELSIGLVEPFGSGSTGEEATGAALLSPGTSEKTIYIRANATLSPESAEQSIYNNAKAEGGYEPLVTAKPGYANVPMGTVFGGHIEFEGATSDLRHIVIHSGVPLVAKTPEGNLAEGGGLYEWSSGQLQLISILPEHKQESGAFLGQTESYNARGAISNDGSRVVWSANKGLYMRDTPNGQTIQLDAVQGGVIGEPGAQFQFASSDGSKVFFTDEARLTEHSTATAGEPDLYECEMIEVSEKLQCRLSDLTEDPNGHADVQGVVVGGSEDSFHLYFVAKGQLTKLPNSQHEEAEAGGFNLYALQYNKEKGEWEAPVLIAVLSGEDGPDWGAPRGIAGDLEAATSRVSPNGEYMAFMSEKSLTGYDNINTNSGAADEEVFLYDVRSNTLVCVSCNATGERPVGVLDSPEANGGEGLLVDEQNNWKTSSGRWLSGDIPGWAAMRAAVARYQPRYLSDSGRILFNSADGLVPQDTNGLMDVYEYEPRGVGGCTESSSTFSELMDGCVGLISSGSSGEESAFIDASASGNDVFFLTSSQLVSEDKDTAFDMYDAHVCSSLAPCSPETVSPPACATTDTCKIAPPPQPLIFGASGSATFSGSGNIAWPSLIVTRCARGRKLRHGKCVMVRNRRKKRQAQSREAKYKRRGGR